MTTVNKFDYKGLFERNIVHLKYENRKGEVSVRRMTLIKEMINYKPSENPDKILREEKEDQVTVWDLDKNMWRKLNINNILYVIKVESPDDAVQSVPS